MYHLLLKIARDTLVVHAKTSVLIWTTRPEQTRELKQMNLSYNFYRMLCSCLPVSWPRYSNTTSSLVRPLSSSIYLPSFLSAIGHWVVDRCLPVSDRPLPSPYIYFPLSHVWVINNIANTSALGTPTDLLIQFLVSNHNCYQCRPLVNAQAITVMTVHWIG